MAQLRKLKWIPMIIQAYNEARNRIDWRSLPSVQATRAQQSGSTPEVPFQQTRQSPVRARKPVKRFVHPKRITPQLPRVQAKVANTSYRSVIRELRETRHKLNQLESIQQKLDQLHSTLEKQFSALSQHEDEQGAPASRIQRHDASNDPHIGGTT